MKLDREYWRGKRVVVTGHTGFKGSWLCLLLDRLGAKVSGFSLAPHTEPSLYALARVGELMEGESLADIRGLGSLQDFMKSAAPEVVFHLAAQPIVADAYRTPLDNHMVNVMGTANLLEACRETPSLKSVIVVTSDKCYLNEGGVWPFRENDSLGGSDPYSASKACAEIIARSYAESFLLSKGVAVNSVRAGNIVGGGDWAAYRLVPDIVRALFENKKLTIRMPGATRPWQHVLDALVGYVLVAQNLRDPEKVRAFDSWNFGPDYGGSVTVNAMLEAAREIFPRLEWIVEALREVKEAPVLALDSSKARQQLGWRPAFDTRETLRRSFAWYSHSYQGVDAREICTAEIDEILGLTARRPG